MLHAEVAESPAAQHDKAFQNDVFVYFPSARGDMEDSSVECIRRIARQDKGTKMSDEKSVLRNSTGITALPERAFFLKAS